MLGCGLSSATSSTTPTMSAGLESARICTSRGTGTSSDWKKAIRGWYDEVGDYRGNPGRYTSNLGAGHFTQLIWGETRYLGCHFIKHEGYMGSPSLNSGYYICNYGPAGNFIGNAMFEVGAACSRCPAGSVCDDGLCSFSSTSSSSPQLTPSPVTTVTPSPRPVLTPPINPFTLPDPTFPLPPTTATTARPARNPNCNIKTVTGYLEQCYALDCNAQCDVRRAIVYLEACFS